MTVILSHEQRAMLRDHLCKIPEFKDARARWALVRDCLAGTQEGEKLIQRLAYEGSADVFARDVIDHLARAAALVDGSEPLDLLLSCLGLGGLLGDRASQVLPASHPGSALDSQGIESALADLLRERYPCQSTAPEGNPWPTWIRRCNQAINRCQDTPEGGHEEMQARWLLEHTQAGGALAVGVLHCARTHWKDYKEGIERRIESLSNAIVELKGLSAEDAVKACRLADAEFHPTAAVLRLTPGEGGAYGFESGEFFCPAGAGDEEEGYRRVDLGLGRVPVRLDNASGSGDAGEPLSLADLVDRMLRWMGEVGAPPVLEIVLPLELITRWDAAPECWCGSDGKKDLGFECRIVLRSPDGFTRSDRRRSEHWQRLRAREAALAAHGFPGLFESVSDRFKRHRALLKGCGGDYQRFLCLMDAEARGETETVALAGLGCDELRSAVDAGISVAIWLRRREDRPAPSDRSLVNKVKPCRLDDLTDGLYRLRMQVGRDHPLFRVALLMDNPRRIRPRGTLQAPTRVVDFG